MSVVLVAWCPRLERKVVVVVVRDDDDDDDDSDGLDKILKSVQSPTSCDVGL